MEKLKNLIVFTTVTLLGVFIVGSAFHTTNVNKSPYTILNKLTETKTPFEYKVYNYGSTKSLVIFIDLISEDKQEKIGDALNEGLVTTCNKNEVGSVTIIVRQKNTVVAAQSWSCLQLTLGA